MSIEWLNDSLPLTDIYELDEIFLLKYLNSQDEIKKCPMKNCTFAGFIDNNNKNCKIPFECSVCSTTWTDNTTDKTYFSEIKNTFMEEISELRIKLFYKPCYHCQRNTYKYVGCNHMTCSCKNQFCYFCLGDWNDHKIEACNLKADCCMSTIALLFLIFIIKTIDSSDFSKYILVTCLRFLVLEVFICLFIFITFLFIYTWCMAVFWRQKTKTFYRYNRIVTTILLIYENYPLGCKIAATICHLGYYHTCYYLYSNYEFANTFLRYVFIELAVVSVGTLIYFICFLLRNTFLPRFLFGIALLGVMGVKYLIQIPFRIAKSIICVICK